MISEASLYTTIAAFVSGVFGPLFVFLVRKKFLPNSTIRGLKNKEFSILIKNQNIINNALNDLQEHYKVDRIWISQFHNGGNFWPSNQSMKKLSVTFESTALGVSTDIMQMQSIPVSFFSGVLDKMMDDESYITLTMDKLKDNALRSYWSSRGVATVCLFPIYCLDKMLVGLMCVELLDMKSSLTSQQCAELYDEAKKLSGYIVNIAIQKSDT